MADAHDHGGDVGPHGDDDDHGAVDQKCKNPISQKSNSWFPRTLYRCIQYYFQRTSRLWQIL